MRMANQKPIWRQRAPEIKKMRSQGITFREIGAHFGVSASSVSSDLRRYEIAVYRKRKDIERARKRRDPEYLAEIERQKTKLREEAAVARRAEFERIARLGRMKSKAEFARHQTMPPSLERQCWKLHSRGHSVLEIARILGVSRKAVIQTVRPRGDWLGRFSAWLRRVRLARA